MLTQITELAKDKERSDTTHRNTHAPLLAIDTQYKVVYIGDSMFERLKTPDLITSLHNLPNSLNLGVGSDKIENVLYRLKTGLWDSFHARRRALFPDGEVKLFVLHAGSNNLRKEDGFRAKEIEAYELLARALLAMGGEECKVLCTGLFRRKDVPESAVRMSNGEIEGVVKRLNQEFVGRVRYLASPEEVGTDDRWLVDDAHLTVEGYHACDRVLGEEVRR